MSHGQRSKKKEGKEKKAIHQEQNNIKKERRGYREKGQQRKRSE